MKLGNVTLIIVLKTVEKMGESVGIPVQELKKQNTSEVPRQKMGRQMRVERFKQILSGDTQVVSFFFILET